MDDLLTVVSELSVDSTIPNNPSAPHPRFSGIKSRKPCDQAKRRAYLLAEQKRRRANVFDSSRDLSVTASTAAEQSAQKRPWHTATKSEPDDNLCEVVEDTEEYGKKPCLKQNLSKSPQQHKGRLMLSEWLVDIPEDLKDSWYMVPCPEGKRSCVSSFFKKGRVITKAFTRHGYSLLDGFKSTLPKSTTLDCIWSPANSTFYVIDVLEWNGMSVLECETEFRFSWLRGKFEEMVDVFVKSPENTFAFTLLPFYACADAVMSDVMSRYPTFANDVPRLDGLLFYHVGTHYRAGPTPLVGWLKPHMMPEVLGIAVADDFKCLTLRTKQKKRQMKGSKWVQPSVHNPETETMETETLVPEPASNELTVENGEQSIETECAPEPCETDCDVTSCD